MQGKIHRPDAAGQKRTRRIKNTRARHLFTTRENTRVRQGLQKRNGGRGGTDKIKPCGAKSAGVTVQKSACGEKKRKAGTGMWKKAAHVRRRMGMAHPNTRAGFTGQRVPWKAILRGNRKSGSMRRLAARKSARARHLFTTRENTRVRHGLQKRNGGRDGIDKAKPCGAKSAGVTTWIRQNHAAQKSAGVAAQKRSRRAA